MITLSLAGRRIDVYAISPRTLDPAKYWADIRANMAWSEEFGCTGVLLFTGNDVYVDPWLVAETVMRDTRRLVPLVAVNPVVMHPFTTARMISSLAYMHGRAVAINWVAGAALSYLAGLGDSTAHDRRYDRLIEYATIVGLLLQGQGLSTFDGTFYRVQDLQLLPPLPRTLFPAYLIAGESAAARHACEAIGAAQLQMLTASPVERGDLRRAVHFGIVTRPTTAEAARQAQTLFPESRDGQIMLDMSMANSDSIWKRRLYEQAGAPGQGALLTAFRNGHSDCPYLVGSHAEVAQALVRVAQEGASMIVLDVPASREEFENIAAAFAIAGRHLEA